MRDSHHLGYSSWFWNCYMICDQIEPARRDEPWTILVIAC